MIYRLTKRAKTDLERIYHYTIEQFGYDQAILYLGGLETKFELLCTHPRLGQLIRDDRYRLTHEEHIILYRLVGHEVRIIRVWSPRRRSLPKGWA